MGVRPGVSGAVRCSQLGSVPPKIARSAIPGTRMGTRFPQRAYSPVSSRLAIDGLHPLRERSAEDRVETVLVGIEPLEDAASLALIERAVPVHVVVR